MPDFNQRFIFSIVPCYMVLFCLIAAPLMAQSESEIVYQYPQVVEMIGEPVYETEIIQSANASVGPQELSIENPCLKVHQQFTIREGDEVWFANARNFIDGETNIEALQVSQFLDGQLAPRCLSDLTNAHETCDEGATMLFVHGNQTDEKYALLRGLQVYRNALTSLATPRVPVRFVIWAWKSDREKFRLYPDFQVKSKRAVLVGETFAATLNQFHNRNLVVFGYSLGTQVSLSAFDSPTLRKRPYDSTQYQLIFAAPVINTQFVASHSLMAQQSESIIENTVVISNRKDRAIRAAQSIIRRQSPAVELTIKDLSQAGKLNVGSVTEVDVFEEAGRLHRVVRYSQTETLQRIVTQCVNRASTKRVDAIFHAQ